MKLNRFAIYAWIVLAYNLVVILWGAYVRATGSGAGCGSHWPLCNGEVIPRAPQLETLIEFTHRLSSGLALILVVGLFIWAWRAYPKGSPVRLGAGLSLFFIFTEALVGAALVLFEMVALNASTARAFWMALHLVNTFLLLAVLTLTGWWASGGKPVRWKGTGLAGWLLGIGFVAMLFLGVSGAVTALGDTLFPAGSLTEGISQDFLPTAHLLVRLRVFHPLIAILVGLYVMLAARSAVQLRPTEMGSRLSGALIALYLVQLGVGVLNVSLLAPVWLQLVHLLLADLVWITLVLLAAVTLARSPVSPEVAPPQPVPAVGLGKQSSG